MFDLDTNFAPPPFGVGPFVLAALALASALFWGEVLALAWRMLG